MGIAECLRTSTLIGALLTVPGVSLAAPSKASEALPCQACTSNYSQKAVDLLTALQMEAEQTARHAAYVENLANSPGIDWKAAASQLNHIRAEVDNMDQRIYQLDVIQRMVPPWERRAIDDAGLLVSYMAVNADSALHNAAARQKDPTGIRTDLQRMDRQANELARAMSTDARSARVDLRTMFLQPNLGMLEVFGK